jgi:NADH-quinone oxidoreductase subunit L
LNKWYFDDFYDWLIVKPIKRLGLGLWKSGDGDLIDGVGPDGIAAAVVNLSRRASNIQSGYIYHYAFAMLIGIALLVTWYIAWTGR